MAKKKVENMTETEAIDRIHELMAQRSAIKAEQQELSRRINQIRAEETVNSMTDSERAALAQVLAPNGVPSGESVGTPGK